MPWESRTVIEERLRFILEYQKKVLSEQLSMAELCEQFNISRKTGYKLVDRHRAEGWDGLADRSRAPASGAHWTAPELCEAVVQTKEAFSDFGAKKIIAHLRRIDPERQWPSISATHQILKRAGLVQKRKLSRRYPHPGVPPLIAAQAPNETWSADFKGQFRTRDRRYCFPLTIADACSRYLLACESLLEPSFQPTWRVFERVFRQYGLPQAIRSDNGTPFASRALRRLSLLSVRWIRLGIRPELIEPGKPQQNGRHERMHKTLKEKVCLFPAANSRQQQKEFDHFRRHYNEVRPHESLGQIPPAQFYSASPRTYPARLPQIEYPSALEVRKVLSNGQIKWRGQALFLSEVLVGEHVGLRPVADAVWILFFGPLTLGYYSEKDRRLYLDNYPA